MNSLKTQLLGFINTPSLFKELHGLNQFEIDPIEIKKFDFTKLIIPENLNQYISCRYTTFHRGEVLICNLQFCNHVH